MDSRGRVDLRALLNDLVAVFGVGNRARPDNLMAVVGWAPKTHSTLASKPAAAGRLCTPGLHSGGSPRLPRPNAMALQTTTVAQRHCTNCGNVRSIVDNGLISAGPHRHRISAHMRPKMPWDMSYKANFVQHSTTLISLDPVALPDKVPVGTIAQSTQRDSPGSSPHPSGHDLGYHHEHRHGLTSQLAGRQVARHDGPMRASLAESRATQCVRP